MTNEEAIKILENEVGGIPSDLDKSDFENAVALAITALAQNEPLKLYVEKLKHQIFVLSYALDSESAGKDYIALRNTHYNNQVWLHDNGLSEEYYRYWVKRG